MTQTRVTSEQTQEFLPSGAVTKQTIQREVSRTTDPRDAFQHIHPATHPSYTYVLCPSCEPSTGPNYCPGTAAERGPPRCSRDAHGLVVETDTQALTRPPAGWREAPCGPTTTPPPRECEQAMPAFPGPLILGFPSRSEPPEVRPRGAFKACLPLSATSLSRTRI